MKENAYKSLFFFFSLGLFCLTSCIDVHKRTFSFDSFEEHRLDSINVEYLFTEEDEPITPNHLVVTNGGKLLIYDKGHRIADTVWVMDLYNGRYIKDLSPFSDLNNRVVTSNFRREKDGFCLTIFNEGNIIKGTIDEQLNISILDKRSEKDLGYQGIVSGDNVIIESVRNGVRLKKYDANDSLCAVNKHFPLERFPLNNFTFYADLSMNMSGDTIVLVNRNWNSIEFYDSDLNELFVLEGPAEDNKTFNEIISKPNYFSVERNGINWNTFKCISVSEQQFMVGYIGRKENDAETNPYPGINRIFSFDWTGHPLDMYILEKDLVCFDCDFQNMIIYGIDKDSRIVKYKL